MNKKLSAKPHDIHLPHWRLRPTPTLAMVYFPRQILVLLIHYVTMYLAGKVSDDKTVRKYPLYFL